MLPFKRPSAAPAALPILINPPRLYDPRPNGYSHVAVATSPARFIYVAGQGGEDAAGELPPAFEAQVRQAFCNLLTALDAAGAGVVDVVKLVVLIVDHSEARLAVLRREIAAVWGDEPPPVCTLIPVPRLALDGMCFEVEATAVQAVPTAARAD